MLRKKENKLREESSFKGRTSLFEMGISFTHMYASNIEHSLSTISSEALNQIGDESDVLSELSLIPDILDDDSDKVCQIVMNNL